MKKILFLLSCLISYLLFYYITSVLIDVVFQGQQEFYLFVCYIAFIAQTVLLFSLMELIILKRISSISIKLLWILYFMAMLILLFARKTIDNNISLDLTQLINTNGMNVVQIVLNFIFFMPIGFLLRNKNTVMMSVISICIILGIEIIQLLTHRGMFDVVDIVVDYFGVYAGFLLAKRFNYHHEIN